MQDNHHVSRLWGVLGGGLVLGLGTLLYLFSAKKVCEPTSFHVCIVSQIALGLTFLVGVCWALRRWKEGHEGVTEEAARASQPGRDAGPSARRVTAPGESRVGTQVQIAASLEEVPCEAWDALVPDEKQPLKTSFLRALADAPPHGLVAQRYVWWMCDGSLKAVAVFQLVDVPLGDTAARVPAWLQGSLGRWVGLSRKHADDSSTLRILMCGNVLTSGTFGFHYDAACCDMKTCLAQIQQVARQLQRELATQGQPVAWFGLKDIAEEHRQHTRSLTRHGMAEGYGEPVMVLRFEPGWKTMDDYLQAMSSKYRQRYRAARKKGRALQRRTLSLAQIVEESVQIDRLFEEVLSRADFCMTRPHAAMLAALKQHLGDDMIVQILEVEGKAVGFLAAYRCCDTLEANWVGMDYEANNTHQVYQNLLYDFVELAFAHGMCDGVDFGRTAPEIKSCLGAAPKEMTFYLRGPGPGLLSRPLLASALPQQPQQDWVQRHPFRKGPSAS